MNHCISYLFLRQIWVNYELYFTWYYYRVQKYIC